MTNYRNDARDYFKSLNLQYGDITEELLNTLRDMLNKAIKDCKSDYWVHVSFKKPKFNKDGLAFVELLGKGTYFEARECITFNYDGFIGFCGDADQENTKPITETFVKWCDIVYKNKKGV